MSTPKFRSLPPHVDYRPRPRPGDEVQLRSTRGGSGTGQVVAAANGLLHVDCVLGGVETCRMAFMTETLRTHYPFEWSIVWGSDYMLADGTACDARGEPLVPPRPSARGHRLMGTNAQEREAGCASPLLALVS